MVDPRLVTPLKMHSLYSRQHLEEASLLWKNKPCQLLTYRISSEALNNSPLRMQICMPSKPPQMRVTVCMTTSPSTWMSSSMERMASSTCLKSRWTHNSTLTRTLRTPIARTMTSMTTRRSAPPMMATKIIHTGTRVMRRKRIMKWLPRSLTRSTRSLSSCRTSYLKVSCRKKYKKYKKPPNPFMSQQSSSTRTMTTKISTCSDCHE